METSGGWCFITCARSRRIPVKITVRPKNIRYNAPVLVCVLLIFFLLLLPTGYEDAVQ